ncbi:MAG: MFS family permease [Candidatus Azotimanducaceae bacterium]|jgi:MFS family permease
MSSSMKTGTQVEVSRSAAVIAFALGALFFGYAFIQRVSPSVMTAELMREFSVGATALGSLSAFYFYTYAAIQLPVGMLTDRFGPRKLMSAAAGLCAFATIGFALSDSIVTASIGRALIGGTVAFAFVGTLSIAGYWFSSSRYTLLAGLLQSVGMCGAIFGQAPLRHLVESLGWRGTMTVLAGVAVLLSILLFVLVPRRSADQLADASHTSSDEGSIKDSSSQAKLLDGLKSVSSNLQTWICAIIGFGLAATMLGFGALWSVPWLTTVHGYSTVQAGGIASMIFVGWAIFSPLVGWLSDKIGRRNPVMMSGALLCLLSFATLILYTPSTTGMIMLLIFMTGAGGCTMTAGFSSVRELNRPAFSSTALGLMNMFIVGAGAVVQPLIGWLLDKNWDGSLVEGVRVYSEQAFTAALTSLLVVTSLAFIGTLFLKETYGKQQVNGA